MPGTHRLHHALNRTHHRVLTKGGSLHGKTRSRGWRLPVACAPAPLSVTTRLAPAQVWREQGCWSTLRMTVSLSAHISEKQTLTISSTLFLCVGAPKLTASLSALAPTTPSIAVCNPFLSFLRSTPPPSFFERASYRPVPPYVVTCFSLPPHWSSTDHLSLAQHI